MALSISKFPSENPDPVIRIAGDGTIAYCNEKGLKVLSKWKTKTGSKAPDKWRRLIAERLTTETIGQEEEKTEDGKFFSVVIAPIKEAGYANLYFRDITERKHAEDMIQEHSRLYKALFEQANDAIFLMENEKFIDCNKRTLEIFQVSREEIINQPPTRFSPEFQSDGRRSTEKAMEKIKAAYSGEPQFFEWTHTHSDGTPFNAEVSLGSIKIGGRPLLQAVVRDITERKRAEEEIRKALETKSEFVSVVSHELRTPLTAIKEGIALVVDEVVGEINSEQKELLDISKKNVDRLARLINNVLDFQKLDSGMMKFNVEMCDINDVAKEVYDIMAISAKNAGLNLTMELDTSLPKCSFDKDKIVQVLTNLTANSIKFTTKGDITIKTAKSPGAVEVSVSDTGCGIRKNDMANVFGKFEQLEHGGSRKTGGTGLGLAISKEIVEWHKGEICVESIYGKGSKFTFTLPMQESNKNTGNKHTKETKVKAGQYNS